MINQRVAERVLKILICENVNTSRVVRNRIENGIKRKQTVAMDPALDIVSTTITKTLQIH